MLLPQHVSVIRPSSGGIQQEAKDSNYCMPLDDGRMTEAYCVNNVRRGEEELMR
jgi:hypothetical protein